MNAVWKNIEINNTLHFSFLLSPEELVLKSISGDFDFEQYLGPPKMHVQKMINERKP